jgi:hypothetical protein
MSNNTCAHHIEIYVQHALHQVLIGLNRRGMVTVFPEGALPALPGIILLTGPARDQLHAFGDCLIACVHHQDMDVVRCHGVVQDAQMIAFLGFEQPPQIPLPVLLEFQQKFFLMAAVGQVPCVSG